MSCSKAQLTAFIQAYAIAVKTENQILMGLAGDAINKLLDTIQFDGNTGTDQETKPSNSRKRKITNETDFQ